MPRPASVFSRYTAPVLAGLLAALTPAITAGLALHTTAHAATTLDPAAQAIQHDVAKLGEARFTAPDYKPGTVRHMVFFHFKPGATAEQRQEVTRRFLALAQDTRRPDGTPVIAGLEAGPQSSGENSSSGLEYGYLVTFRSEGDRNYYVGRPIVKTSGHFDPAHDAFKAFAAPYLANVVVFDFTTPTAP